VSSISYSLANRRLAWGLDELASFVTPRKKVDILAAFIGVGKNMVMGAVVKGLYDLSMGKKIDIPSSLVGALLAVTVGLVSDHFLDVLRNDLQRQNV
jgi:hypothetical protein